MIILIYFIFLVVISVTFAVGDYIAVTIIVVMT